MQKNKLKLLVQVYLSSAALYGLGIVLFKNFSYYKENLSPVTQKTLLYFYFAYIVLAPFYYYFFSQDASKSKPYVVLRWVYNSFGKKRNIITKEEKTAILFVLVKLFFLPTMINFAYDNLDSLFGLIRNFQWYSFVLTIVFAADTLIFAFGYLFEFRILGNIVKSVEPTFFGWIVALICYPPFNSYAGNFIPWGANDYAKFSNTQITLLVRIVLVFLLLFYLFATLALGFKASNLTNRGVVTKFPYSVIRHPAYASKNLWWWITLLPVISWSFAIGMAFWTVIYYFRAVTEENHLSQDPSYVAYCRKVKYRFIPYLI